MPSGPRTAIAVADIAIEREKPALLRQMVRADINTRQLNCFPSCNGCNMF